MIGYASETDRQIVDHPPERRTMRRREADVRLDLAMEVIEGGYWHYDIASAVFETSLQLARFVTGPDAAPLNLDAYIAQIVSEDRHKADMSRLITGEVECLVAEYRVRTYVGSVRWMRCRCRIIRDDCDRPTRLIGMAIDVTEQKNLHAWVERQAKTDPLTSLGNRRGFEERAETHLSRSKSSRTPYIFGLLMLDLDRFKPINDQYGHLTGDSILKLFAHRLSGAVRPIDYVARLGGDEFAILVDDTDDLNLSKLAERLVRVVAEPMEVDGHCFEIGCSLGATRVRSGDCTVEGLIARADAALYDAKYRGRGSWRLSA